ncbi:MAG: ATP-dependent Clp protease ATP-binding subunit [Acidobacteria bacterium]|nr:ATP-dependent Clp protease ATP-binding subunit [Acidobacteriota bacterium]
MANTRLRRPVPETGDLLATLMEKVVGQSSALEAIVPYVHMYQAGLAPEGRPVGVFLLLGPTGTGKTHTVEALAGAIHSSERHLLRIDCGEFQMEHEVAKLIGAPPGYLGHRETSPLLTQQKLNAATSERSNLSIVLFDEIEKAAPSLNRLLLGVLDKAVLRLGDNTVVNFERSLIFLTSNLGARGMSREMRPDFGFDAMVDRGRPNLHRKLENIALQAVRKRFSPEFVNRIDVISTYQPLSREALARILEQQLDDFRLHVQNRLGQRAFAVELSGAARQFLLRKGASPEYGARELKRTLLRHLIQPIAGLVARGLLDAGGCAYADSEDDGEHLEVRCLPPADTLAA